MTDSQQINLGFAILRVIEKPRNQYKSTGAKTLAAFKPFILAAHKAGRSQVKIAEAVSFMPKNPLAKLSPLTRSAYVSAALGEYLAESK